MKKKHLLYLLFTGILITGGCSSGGGEDIPDPSPKPEQPNNPQQPVPTITINPGIISNGLSFSNEAGSKTISFSSNTDWTLSLTDGSNWCTPSVTKGNQGNVSVTFSVSANEETDDRKTTVSIKASTAGQSFTIVQEKLYVLSATTEKDTIGFKGGILTFQIETNADFQISTNEDWIRLKGENSRTLQKEQVTFEVDANTLHEQRQAEITFSNEQKKLKQTLIINQEALPEDKTEKPTGNIGDMSWG